MSDSENSDILEDIRQLQNALSQPQPTASTSKSETHLPSYDQPHSPKFDFSANDDKYIADNEPSTSKDFKGNDASSADDNERLLEINQKLLDLYQNAKEKFTFLLENCKKKLELLEQKLSNNVITAPTKHYTWTIGMPYFKTSDSYFAPLNEDAKLKASRGELEIMHLRHSIRWTARDKTILLRAIHDEVIQKYDQPKQKSTSRKIFLSAEIKRCIGPLGAMEFDWMTIGSREFQNRHTADECRVIWNVFLHPDINKTKWTSKEEAQLKVMAKTHHFQNWDAVARKLNTGRSGYQCFIRYKTHVAKQIFKSNNIWKKEENETLQKTVEKLKIGNYIPWSEVAICMPMRTKQQVYYHWNYNVAPHLRKGRFTGEEDDTLRESVAKYGLNFSKIAAFIMPQRTSAQLSDHYNTLCTRETNEKLGKVGRIWDIKDDIKLLSLYETYGTNWSRISKEFEYKTRIQLRHRHAALKRYAARGISLNEIPRAVQNDSEDEDAVIYPSDDDIDDVDKELIEYFRNARQVAQTRQCANVKTKVNTSEELVANVRTLYNILQSLHVNIISSNFVDLDTFNQRDRQLFHVLNEFSKSGTSDVNNALLIETYRILMFGESLPCDESERYIPPPPFSVMQEKFSKKSAKNALRMGIDYATPNNENFQIALDFEPKVTVENVRNMIGDEQDIDFDKLKDSLVASSKKSLLKQQNRIYILSPEVLNKSSRPPEIDDYFIVNHKNEPTDEEVKLVGRVEMEEDVLRYTWDWRKAVPGIEDDVHFLNPSKPHRSSTVVGHFNEVFPFLKPNYSTMSSYQGVFNAILSDKKPVIDIESSGRYKVSHRGRIALDLLARRFQILFTYPMYMARIAIPPEMDKKSSELSIFDDVDSSKTDKKRKGRTSDVVRVKKQRVSLAFEDESD